MEIDAHQIGSLLLLLPPLLVSMDHPNDGLAATTLGIHVASAADFVHNTGAANAVAASRCCLKVAHVAADVVAVAAAAADAAAADCQLLMFSNNC